MRQQVQLAGDFQHGVAGKRVRRRVPRVFEPQAFGTRDGGDAHDVQERELPDGGGGQV